MAFTVEFDEKIGDRRRRPGARLNARQRNENPGVIWVKPERSTESDTWGGYDTQGEYLRGYTTGQLVALQRYGTQSVRHYGSDLPWSRNDERVFADHGKLRATTSRNPNTGKRRRKRRGNGGTRERHDRVWLALAGKD